jgi:hypothetical protein
MCKMKNVITRLKLLFEHLGIHQDPNSQSGSSLGSVKVYSLTFSCTLKNMEHDSWASFLARNLTTPCFGHEPKARVATEFLVKITN